MQLQRSRLDALSDPGRFLWLAGIEDTFITAPSPKTGRALDEYELTGHYRRWREDLGLLAALRVPAARYGIPWHRVNPSPGRWDFACADGPLERLLELGIEPVVDLVHYGLPSWLEGSFLNPDFDAFLAEYAARVAERYRGRIRAYTPLNEPRVTAWYCGKLGWWPPRRRGWRGFVAVMLGVCRGIVRACEALVSVDPEIVLAHVDATDLYVAASADLRAEARRRQELVFLALDLVSGRMRPDHPLHDWLLAQGARPGELEWFSGHAVALDLVGINLYPLFSQKTLARSPRGLRTRMRYASAEIVELLAEMYWARYRRPLFISETASLGPRRREWLEESVSAVRRVRAGGVPLVGYTWWPLFGLVTWGYREGTRPKERYLRQMGLFDLQRGRDGLEPVATPLVGRYRELVEGGAAAVGPLARAAVPAQGRVHVQ